MIEMDEVKIRDKVRVRGRVRATVRDAETGEILEVVPGKNLVTDVGEALFSALMNGESLDSISYCAVGSDDAAVAEGDTTLTAEIDRIPITDSTRVAALVTYSTFFSSGDCNGVWKEEGLLNAAVGGVLVCHTLFAAPINKDATKTVTVDHDLEIV